MKTSLAAFALAAAANVASAQTPDISFYTDTGSNFGDTGFTMPFDAPGVVPGTYGETIAFPYYYAPLNPGDTLNLSYVTLSGSNYINSGGGRGGGVSRHHTGHIVATPALYTVTPVIVFSANVAADGSGPFYAVSGTAYNAGDLVQYDPSGDYIDQNGNSIVTYGYTTVGTVGSPINTCGTFYVNNPDGSYQFQLSSCTLGYLGNIVDANHQTGFTQYGNSMPAVDVNGSPVVFTCTHNVNLSIPVAYKDRVLDICTLGTQQTDGSVTNGALLPPAEYWMVLPYDTACSTTGTVLCSGVNPNTNNPYGTSGDAIIYSRTALGGVTRAAPPPCGSECDDGVRPNGRRN